MRQPIEDISALKLVSSENFHMTLKFLGDVTTEEYHDLDSLVQRRLPTPGPITISLEELGTFPNLSNPSVVWAGVRPTEELTRIHETLETIATEVGFDPEEHDFRPHITLARVKGRLGNQEGLVRWLETHGNRKFGEFEIDEVTMFESDLQPEGPEYHEVASWPL